MSMHRLVASSLALILTLGTLPAALQADGDSHRRNPLREAKSNGCQGHPHTEDSGREPAAKVRIVGTYRDRSEAHGSHLPVANLVAVKIGVKWLHLPQGGTQRLELFTPDGALFGAYTTRVTDREPVETVVPTTGWITQHALYGAWCLEVFLMGEPEPIARKKFVLDSR